MKMEFLERTDQRVKKFGIANVKLAEGVPFPGTLQQALQQVAYPATNSTLVISVQVESVDLSVNRRASVARALN